MKKLNYIFLIVFSATIVFFSCSDEPERKEGPVNFLTEYLEKSGFVIMDSAHYDAFEFGLSFETTTPGTIEKIYIRLPQNKTNVRVTLWDGDGTILRTIYVPEVQTHQAKWQQIEPLTLEADHTYAITLNSTDWYRYERHDGTPAPYPITIDNIKIVNYLFAPGTEQKLPAGVSLTHYAGDLSFEFKTSTQ